MNGDKAGLATAVALMANDFVSKPRSGRKANMADYFKVQTQSMLDVRGDPSGTRTYIAMELSVSIDTDSARYAGH